MKITKKWKWFSCLLAGMLLLTAATGCGKPSQSVQSSESSGPSEISSAEAEDDPSTRYATLISVQNFIETFKPRGKMTDYSGSTDSAEEEAPVSLLLRNVDDEGNIFYYLDATGQVYLKDLKKDRFIHDFVKGLNKSSDSYHYSDMELMDRGANYYRFKVTIKNKDSGEELSSEEETADDVSEAKETAKTKESSDTKDTGKTKETSDTKDTAKTKESSDTQDTGKTKESSGSKETAKTKITSDTKDTGKINDTSDSTESTKSNDSTEPEDSSAEDETEAVKEDEKPMTFIFVEKGKKTYEIIGLDMEAKDASAFTDSFQEILDQIVKVKEVRKESS